MGHRRAAQLRPISAALLVLWLFFLHVPGTGHAAEQQGGRISGIAWLDLNANGVQEPTELPLAGAAIILLPVGDELNVAGGVVVFTDSTGTFFFSDLSNGRFRVAAVNGSAQLVELGEVNNSVSVMLAITARQIFVPMLQG